MEHPVEDYPLLYDPLGAGRVEGRTWSQRYQIYLLVQGVQPVWEEGYPLGERLGFYGVRWRLMRSTFCRAIA